MKKLLSLCMAMILILLTFTGCFVKTPDHSGNSGITPGGDSGTKPGDNSGTKPGGTEEKPVGLVYIGVYCKENFHVGRYLFRGSRDQIRARSAAVGLNILRCMLKGYDVKHAGSIFLCPRS